MGNSDLGDDSDFEEVEEKYLYRRDSKGSKQRSHQPHHRDRRNSGSAVTKLDSVLAEQPAVEKTDEYCKEVESKPKLGRERSSSFEITNVEEELANLVKDMCIKPKQNDAAGKIPTNILYYGWFFSQTTSDSLNKLSVEYLKECLGIQQFQRWIEACAVQAKVRDLMSYYADSRKPLLHITAKFCGGAASTPYAEQASPFVGSEFTLAIVGLFFTEKTHGFRVKLTEEQEELFKIDHGKLTTRRNSCSANPTPTEPDPATQEKNSVEYSGQLIGKKSKTTSSAVVVVSKVKKHSKINHPGITFTPQRENFQPTDTPAHITIGCRSNIKAKQTRDDLLDIVDMELRASTPFHDFKIPSGILRQFGRHGDYVFVLYPKNRVIAKGVFMPYI